jgi:hypothetical protein
MAVKVPRRDVKEFNYRTNYEEALGPGPEGLFAGTLVGIDHEWNWSPNGSLTPRPGTEVLVRLNDGRLSVIWVNRDVGTIEGDGAPELADLIAACGHCVVAGDVLPRGATDGATTAIRVQPDSLRALRAPAKRRGRRGCGN